MRGGRAARHAGIHPLADRPLARRRTALATTAGVAAHLLPASVLTLNDDGTLGIRSVTSDSTAAFLPVTLLRDTREGVWLAGLPETVDVITLGQEYVENGVRVIPTYREATAEVSQ